MTLGCSGLRPSSSGSGSWRGQGHPRRERGSLARKGSSGVWDIFSQHIPHPWRCARQVCEAIRGVRSDNGARRRVVYFPSLAGSFAADAADWASLALWQLIIWFGNIKHVQSSNMCNHAIKSESSGSEISNMFLAIVYQCLPFLSVKSQNPRISWVAPMKFGHLHGTWGEQFITKHHCIKNM